MGLLCNFLSPRVPCHPTPVLRDLEEKPPLVPLLPPYLQKLYQLYSLVAMTLTSLYRGTSFSSLTLVQTLLPQIAIYTSCTICNHNDIRSRQLHERGKVFGGTTSKTKQNQVKIN